MFIELRQNNRWKGLIYNFISSAHVESKQRLIIICYTRSKETVEGNRTVTGRSFQDRRGMILVVVPLRTQSKNI